jgi:hypothetical protein
VVPGFGGLYYDSSGTLVVVLTDTSFAAAARAPVADLISRLGPAIQGLRPSSEMRVVEGRYDFTALAAWYAAFNNEAENAYGLVTLTDTDRHR